MWLLLVIAGLAALELTRSVLVGGSIIALGLAVAAGTRAVRPADVPGGLHIRSKRIDVITMTLAAVLLEAATVLVYLREGG